MQNYYTKFKISIIALVAVGFLFFGYNLAFASETNGTIVSGGNNGYAWSNQAGWVNYGTTNGGISITDAGITGYAWNNNYGWINMAPTNGGITIAANGALSGYAWSSGLGWINFSGVSINSSGKFVGTASGANIGTLTFDCTNCSVTTDFRAQNFRTVASTPTTVVSSGGGGGGGGIIVGGGTPDHINAYNVPLVILPQQSGTLEQTVRDGKRVIFNIPKNSVPSKTTIIVYEEPLVSGINLSLLPTNADLLNAAFYNVIARNENGALVTSFSNDITITLPVPETLREFSDIGVYWLDESAGVWRKVSGVSWSTDNATATFRVNHLTKFGIFRILTEPLEILSVPAAPETLQPRQPILPIGLPPAEITVQEIEKEEEIREEFLPAQLFDIRLLLDGANVSRVIDLVARVTFESFGRVPTPVSMTFSIHDETGRDVWKSVDTVTVETERVFVKRFFDAPELLPGNYTLRLHTLYNTVVEDEFEAPFTIEPEGAGWNWVPWFVGGLLLLLAILVFVWRLIMRRRKEQEERGIKTPFI